MDGKNEISNCLDSDIAKLLDGDRKPFNHRVSQLVDELGQKRAYHQVHDELIQRARIFEDQALRASNDEERQGCEQKAHILREEAAIFSHCIGGSRRKAASMHSNGRVLSGTNVSLPPTPVASFI